MPVEGDLVVEDGTGLAAANTYAVFADMDAYHSIRGNTDWADATESDKVVALVRATDYIDRRFDFKGYLANPDDQALSFPRITIYDSEGRDQSDVVPPQIVDAVAEYVLQVLQDPNNADLMPDLEDQSGKFITMEREKIGPIEEETRYSEDKGTSTVKSYPYADRIIWDSGLVSSQGGGAIRA